MALVEAARIVGPTLGPSAAPALLGLQGAERIDQVAAGERLEPRGKGGVARRIEPIDVEERVGIRLLQDVVDGQHAPPMSGDRVTRLRADLRTGALEKQSERVAIAGDRPVQQPGFGGRLAHAPLAASYPRWRWTEASPGDTMASRLAGGPRLAQGIPRMRVLP